MSEALSDTQLDAAAAAFKAAYFAVSRNGSFRDALAAALASAEPPAREGASYPRATSGQRRDENRCPYPDCGCDHDAMCGEAVDRAPASPTPEPSALNLDGSARRETGEAALSVGDWIGSPHYIDAIGQKVIGVFVDAAKEGPLQGSRGDFDGISLTEERWASLREALTAVLEKSHATAINAALTRAPDATAEVEGLTRAQHPPAGIGEALEEAKASREWLKTAIGQLGSAKASEGVRLAYGLIDSIIGRLLASTGSRQDEPASEDDKLLPIKAMSTDTENDHVLRLHFSRCVVPSDRVDLREAINLFRQPATPDVPARRQVTEVMVDAACLAAFNEYTALDSIARGKMRPAIEAAIAAGHPEPATRDAVEVAEAEVTRLTTELASLRAATATNHEELELCGCRIGDCTRLTTRCRENIALTRAMDATAEIRELSEKATPGHWEVDARSPSDVIIWSGPENRVCFMTSNGPAEDNARLICALVNGLRSRLMGTLPTPPEPVMSRMMTAEQRRVLELCVGENQTGRIGWRLSIWEQGAEQLCRPLIRDGLLIERRLGGYPGVQITDAGRAEICALPASDGSAS